LAYTILSFLSIENLRDANLVMDEYLEKGEGWKPSGGGSSSKPSASPLLSFCYYLLSVCERTAPPLYQYLLKAYEGYLQDQQLQQVRSSRMVRWWW